MIIVDVFVPGTVKTKGSMEVGNKATGWLRESVIGSSAWRALMAAQVRDDITRRAESAPSRAEIPITPWYGPVRVTVVAYLRVPDTDPYADQGLRRRGWLQWLWPIWERAGDLDKITRNVLDALGSRSKNAKYNGGAIEDDNQVCKIIASKHVADPARPPGVRIIVETIGD